MRRCLSSAMPASFCAARTAVTMRSCSFTPWCVRVQVTKHGRITQLRRASCLRRSALGESASLLRPPRRSCATAARGTWRPAAARSAAPARPSSRRSTHRPHFTDEDRRDDAGGGHVRPRPPSGARAAASKDGRRRRPRRGASRWPRRRPDPRGDARPTAWKRPPCLCKTRAAGRPGDEAPTAAERDTSRRRCRERYAATSSTFPGTRILILAGSHPARRPTDNSARGPWVVLHLASCRLSRVSTADQRSVALRAPSRRAAGGRGPRGQVRAPAAARGPATRKRRPGCDAHRRRPTLANSPSRR